MSNIKKIAVLNIDSRYLEILSAKVMVDNGAKEDIKSLGKKEHSGIIGQDLVNKEEFEKILKDFVKVIANKDIDQVFVGVPSNLCKIEQFEKIKKSQKPFRITDEIINDLEDEVKKELNDENYTIITTQPIFLKKDNKLIQDLETFEEDELKINYSLILCSTEFIKLIKRSLINTQIIQDIDKLHFILQDIAHVNTLLTKEQIKSQYLTLKIEDYSTVLSYGYNNTILSNASFKIGLINIEQDIYMKLSLPSFDEAINMLQSFDIMQDGSKQFYQIEYQNSQYNMPCSVPVNLTRDKLDEIANKINQTLQNADYEISREVEIIMIPTRAYQLNGLQSYLTTKLGRRCKFIIPSAVKQSPTLTSVYSVLNMASSSMVSQENSKRSRNSIIDKIKTLFKKK